jgi:hypothetical protein
MLIAVLETIGVTGAKNRRNPPGSDACENGE